MLLIQPRLIKLLSPSRTVHSLWNYRKWQYCMKPFSESASGPACPPMQFNPAARRIAHAR